MESLKTDFSVWVSDFFIFSSSNFFAVGVRARMLTYGVSLEKDCKVSHWLKVYLIARMSV